MLSNKNNNHYIYFDISLFIFLFCNIIWILFDPFEASFQMLFHINLFNFIFYFGLDGISLFFVYLSCFLIPLCILFSFINLVKDTKKDILSINKYLLCILILLLFAFMSLDLLCFYIFFEMILIPFFILIGVSSFRKRRIHASYLFFFYTLIGSFLMLFSIFNIYSISGTTSIELLLNNKYSFYRESIIWICLFISLAIKVPMFPFHLWLPEAHVEAPTEGSVLLAGLLLKLGTYGFLRFLFPLFPNTTYYYSPIIIFIAILGIFYCSFITLKQIDIKRIIAYSSISHMNICILGLFTFTNIGIAGSIHLMIGHGIVSGGLFFLIGILYNRFHTKIIKYYSGLVYIMPLYSFFFFIFVLGNISFPLTSNFIGELLIIIGLFESLNIYALFFSFIGIFICTLYSIFMYNKLFFLIPSDKYILNTKDLFFIEYCILIPLFFLMLWFGIYPSSFFSIIEINLPFYYLF
jgi:proton-translocating NADH-quinone oxidoreductase chain M